MTGSTATGADFGSCVASGATVTPDAGSYASCRIPVPDGLTDDTRLVFYYRVKDVETVPDGFQVSSNTGQITVAELRGAPDTVIQFYNLATPPPAPPGPTGYPITAYVCDTDPGNWSPYSGREIGGGCEPSSGIQFDVTAEVDATFSASCTTGDDGTCYIEGALYCTNTDLGTLIVAEDNRH